MGLDNRCKFMDKKGILLGIILVVSSIYLSGCAEEKKGTAQGVIIWEKTYDGNDYYDVARSVAVDFDGNIYVVGYISNVSGSIYSDWWIKKLDSNGNEDTANWNKTYGKKDFHEKAGYPAGYPVHP